MSIVNLSLSDWKIMKMFEEEMMIKNLIIINIYNDDVCEWSSQTLKQVKGVGH